MQVPTRAECGEGQAGGIGEREVPREREPQPRGRDQGDIQGRKKHTSHPTDPAGRACDRHPRQEADRRHDLKEEWQPHDGEHASKS